MPVVTRNKPADSDMQGNISRHVLRSIANRAGCRQKFEHKAHGSICGVVVVVAVLSRSPGHATQLTDRTTVTPHTHELCTSRVGTNGIWRAE
jgi:hypothetical protein